MMNRKKEAFWVFVILLVALVALVTSDITENKVETRFNTAIENERYVLNESIKLDTFLEYYDWDFVCIVPPGTDGKSVQEKAGIKTVLKGTDGDEWRLVFIKKAKVAADVIIDRTFVESPDLEGAICLERWAAVVRVVESGSGVFSGIRMSVIGDDMWK